MRTNSPFKRILLLPLVILGVAAMVAEEHLWDALERFGHWVGQLAFLQSLQNWLRQLPPWGAAAALFLPVALIFPVKILAVWLMATGHWGGGLLVLISAKLVGTVLVARIYTLCQPALMQLPWFVRLRQMFLNAKAWAHAKLASWPLWVQVRKQVTGVWASWGFRLCNRKHG